MLYIVTGKNKCINLYIRYKVKYASINKLLLHLLQVNELIKSVDRFVEFVTVKLKNQCLRGAKVITHLNILEQQSQIGAINSTGHECLTASVVSVLGLVL